MIICCPISSVGLVWSGVVCCGMLRCAVACCGVHLSSGVKLFGVTQRELVGEGVRRLLPHPICNYAQVGAHPYSSVDHTIWDTHSVLLTVCVVVNSQPYLALRDTLCSREAYGVRPELKEQKNDSFSFPLPLCRSSWTAAAPTARPRVHPP